MRSQRTVFLDRDGVINVDHGYVSKIDDFEFMPGIFDVLRALSERGFLLVVITNQSGIGRGYYSEEDFNRLTEWMVAQFSNRNISIAGVYSCPHAPEENCSCRKPEPAMLLQAADELEIDLGNSWMVGDKESDMQAAEAAGVPNRIFVGGGEAPTATQRVSSVTDLIGVIN